MITDVVIFIQSKLCQLFATECTKPRVYIILKKILGSQNTMKPGPASSEEENLFHKKLVLKDRGLIQHTGVKCIHINAGLQFFEKCL